MTTVPQAPMPAPHVSTGDSWTYRDTRENGSGWHEDRTEAIVDRAGPAGSFKVSE